MELLDLEQGAHRDERNGVELTRVDFAQEILAVQITGIGNASAAADLTIEVDLF